MLCSKVFCIMQISKLVYWFLGSYTLGQKTKKKMLASLVRICHMVYDFQAGGFSPLINPLAINKSTKQWDSPSRGHTLITRDHRVSHTCRKNAKKVWRRSVLGCLGSHHIGGSPAHFNPPCLMGLGRQLSLVCLMKITPLIPRLG